MITEKLKLLKKPALSQTHKLQRQYPRNKRLKRTDESAGGELSLNFVHGLIKGLMQSLYV